MKGSLKVVAVIAVSIVAIGATVFGVMLWTLFGDKEDPVPSCDSGFARSAWKSDRKATGRAVAECDWFDGSPIGEMMTVLGRPDGPPHRGYYTWELGSSKNGIGPSSWFLVLRAKDGTVTESEADTRPV